MKVSVRRLCLSFSEELSRMKALPLFPFGAFLLPEAIIAANYPALKKKKSINRGWLAIFLDPQKTVSQTYREELSKDREGEINRPGFSQDACLFPDPTPATPTPSKRESCQQGPISKNISSGVTEMLSEVAGLSVLQINGVRHDIFLLAETEHP